MHCRAFRGFAHLEIEVVTKLVTSIAVILIHSEDTSKMAKTQ
jgi:hypothetical protein